MLKGVLKLEKKIAKGNNKGRLETSKKKNVEIVKK